jgi:long-chain fatty acid transport protein
LLNAGGFQLTEMSAKKLGQANAGAAAYGDDASTIFWNPAGLTNLEGAQVSSNISAVNIEADFDKTLAVDAIGNPLTGGEGGDIGTLGIVPATFYARPGDKFSWGVGLHAPFGLSTDYNDDSIFRYQANESNVRVIDINPAMALKVSDTLSLGLGLDIQHLDVELSSSVDYGAVCLAATMDPNGCAAFGLLPQQADGTNTVSGDGIAVGWNIGAMWNLERLSIGLSHRSSVKHKLEGDAVFTNVPALFSAMGLFQNGVIRANFDSPELTMLAAKFDVNDHWTIAADISNTQWSNFEELRIRFDNPVQPDSAETFAWKDVQRISAGVEYKYSDDWTFRSGVSYDESPINPHERSVRLPSSNRTWVAIGTSYQWSKKTSLDAGFVHLFVDDPIELDRTGATAGDRIVGAYTADAEILSFQINHSF